MHRLSAIAVAVASLLLTACSHNGIYTFGPTRKLVESSAPGPTIVTFSPFLAIGDCLMSPVTAYMDAANESGLDQPHEYLSFIGTRTIHRSDLAGGYKLGAFPLTTLIDLIWFPIGGIIDTSHALANE